MPRQAKLGATRDSYVFRVRVPDELRTQWEEHCAKENRKPAATIRLLMRYIMHGDMPEVVQAWLDGQTTMAVDHRAKRRIHIRLTENEYELLKNIADAEESSVQSCIIRCVRGGLLSNDPQTTLLINKTLNDSNYQLRAIGRNLNQIAKAVNSGGDFHATVSQVKNLAEFIQQHLNKTDDLINASIARWKIAAKTNPIN